MTKMNFIPTKEFKRAAKELSKRYKSFKSDLKVFEKEYSDNPNQGDSIVGGFKKIRIAIKSKGKGKSGGARVITYEAITLTHGKNVVLLYVYDKSDMANVRDEFIQQIYKEYISK